MNKLFRQQVDVLLEDVDLFLPASDSLSKVQLAKEKVLEAEKELNSEIDVLNNRLALEIRRANPALTVTIDRTGKCCIYYRNNSKNILSFLASPTNKCFICGETPFERRFRRYHGHCLDCGVDVIGKSVSDFFKQNYRSLS